MSDDNPKLTDSQVIKGLSETAIVRIIKRNNLTPSNSTNASLISGAITAIIIWYAGTKGITFPAGVEAGITGLVATLVGYLPQSGRTTTNIGEIVKNRSA